MEDGGLRRRFRWKILMKVFVGAAGAQDGRSFLGLLGPVLGASALPGRASIVPGKAKPVLGTPNGPRSIYAPRTSSGFITCWGLGHLTRYDWLHLSSREFPKNSNTLYDHADAATGIIGASYLGVVHSSSLKNFP